MSGQQLPPTLNRHELPPPPPVSNSFRSPLHSQRYTVHCYVMSILELSSGLVLTPPNFKFGQFCPYGQLCQFSSSAQHWYSPPSLNSVNSVNSVNYINSQVQISTGPPTPLEIGQFGQLCQFYNLAQHWSSPLEIGQLRLFGQLCQLLQFIPLLISLLRYLEI